MNLKICMIGLGSIGKRHLCNLVKVLKKRRISYQIDALRSGNFLLGEEWTSLLNHQYYVIEEMPGDYDIIFVTNPTALHFNTIKQMLGRTRHMFIEKPVFESVDYDINALQLKKDGIYYVACPLRHKNVMRYVKDSIVLKERIISARVVSTSFLPNWRSSIDYRTVYSAKNDLGGGVTRDLIHEWDYIVYLFGMPRQVLHMQGHYSNLEIDSDDISVYIARYSNMLLEIHLDYIGHKTERILQLFTDHKRIDIDLISNIVYEYENNELKNQLVFPEENFYMNELEFFLDCIEKKRENINTIEDAFKTLKIALTEDR